MKNILRNIKMNFGTFLMFQVLFGLCGFSITAFFYNVVFRWAVGVTVGYIAPHTLVSFLTHPISWLCVFVFVCCYAAFCLTGIVAAVYLNECGRQGLHVYLRDVLKFSLAAVARSVRPGNWKLIVLVVLILPLLNLGLLPAAGSIEIPDFIMEYIGYYWYLTALFLVVIVALAVLAMRWRFVFNIMIVERVSFRQAASSSARLGRKHHIRDALALIACQVAIFLWVGVLIALAVFASVFFGSLSMDSDGVARGVFSMLFSLTAVAGFVAAGIVLLLTVPICYTCLSGLYYQRKAALGEDIPACDLGVERSRPNNKLAIGGAVVSFTAVVVGLSLFVVYGLNASLDYLLKSDSELAAEVFAETDVVAHRCGAHYAPENTIAALNKAADMGVTWCEMDCQQLQDGTIIVMHDTNFKRTTGFDRDSWKATWEEVEPLDAGSFYSAEYAGEKIPQLDAFIKAAKARNIKLQIEIKPTGNEADLEKAVVDIVKANDFQDDCRIASQDYECLKKVREYDHSVRTLYIVSCAFGDIMQADAADDFSIEATWITDELVEYLHEGNRSVFAWTVNSESIMERVVDCGIDALVTDEVELGVEVCRDSDPRNIIASLAAALRI